MAKDPKAGGPSSLAILKRLLADHGRAHFKAYLAAALLLGISAAATAASAYLLKPVVNGMVTGDSLKTLRRLAWVVAGLFVIRGVVSYLSILLLARTGNRIVAEVQKRLFDHIIRQDMHFFHEHHSTDFMTRLSMAAASVRETLQAIVMSFSRDILTLIGLMAVMIVHDPMLALMSLVALPIGGFVLSKLIGKIRRYARRSYDGTGQIMQIMQETILGSRVVKSFNMEALMRERMAHSVRYVEKASNRVATSIALSSPVAEVLAGVAIGLVIFYGSWRITSGSADAGSLFSFIAALLLAYEPARRLANLKLSIQNGVTGAQLIFEILDRPAAESYQEGLPKLTLGDGRVEIRNVSFLYRDSEPVLRDLSLTAEPDKTTALVGPSGGGKSTIIALLQRFYAPDSGTILMDDTDIAGVDLHSLRQQIAFVSQDVFLFRGTIRENIAFGRPGASEEDIIAAAKQAYAHEFIMGFSDTYDTNVGESGAQLSGGQKQRIAIARAILKDAPIILLDEPTAALDSESERMVQQALDALRKGRTTIVVAHRLQTIVNADKIIVIEAGAAVQSGTHAELIAADGTYKNYFANQFGEGIEAMPLRPAARS